MLRSVHFDDDALMARQQQQEIHTLPAKPGAMAQKLHHGGIVMEVDLRDERRQGVAEA